jgi:hypothetical protein
MQQLDLFDETLAKKIVRMEKWTARLQKELWFLKEVYNLSTKTKKIDTSQKRVEQIDMFGT